MMIICNKLNTSSAFEIMKTRQFLSFIHLFKTRKRIIYMCTVNLTIAFGIYKI